MKDKNILITGGTGSLGYALAKTLTKAGASLTITIVFFNSLPTLIAVAVVASSVLEVRATSSSGITATGLKK